MSRVHIAVALVRCVLASTSGRIVKRCVRVYVCVSRARACVGTGQVVRQLARAMQPVLTDVAVDWGVLTPLLAYPSAPARTLPLYTGGRQLLFGVFNTGEGVTVPSSRSSVTVSAKGPDGVMTWRAEVALDAGNDAVFASESAVELGSLTTMIGGTLHCRGRLVHTAAARARIRDLEALAGDSGRNDAVALAVR